MSKRRSRTPRAPPPGVSKRVKGSPRVRNSFIMRNNQTPGWAKKLNEENRNLGMVAMSEDIDQNKLEKFEKESKIVGHNTALGAVSTAVAPGLPGGAGVSFK